MNRIIIISILFFIFSFPLSAQQDYKLDTTFRARCEELAGIRNYRGRTMLETETGMIYLQGTMSGGTEIYTPLGNHKYRTLQRYFPDGKLDTSFYLRDGQGWDGGGLRPHLKMTWHLNKLYVTNQQLDRLTEDGNIDTTFHILTPDTVSRASKTLWLTDSTFILTYGNSSDTFPIVTNRRVRLFKLVGNTATMDTINFDAHLLANFPLYPCINCNGITSIAKQGDKYLVSGDFPAYNDYPNTTGMVRLFADGKVDTTFKSPFRYSNVLSIMVLDNQKILLGAAYGTYIHGDTVGDYNFFRLLPNGELDNSFNNFRRQNTPNSDLKIAETSNIPIPTSDGGYFLVGGFKTGNMDYLSPNIQSRLLLKVDSNGFYDDRYLKTSFIDTNSLSFPVVKMTTGAFRLASGKILVAGIFTCAPDYANYLHLIRIEEPDFQLAASDVEKEKALLKIYPNPSSDELTIELPPALQSSKLTLRLHNQLGQTVHSQAWREDSPTQTISVASLPSGFYVVSVSNGAETWYQKVIIQR